MGKNQKKAAQKTGTGTKLFLTLVMFLNLLLSFLLAVMRRQEVIKAVEEDEKVKVLLVSQKETKS